MLVGKLSRMVPAGVLVFSLILAGATFAKKTPPAHPINLNTATIQELEQLSGIGPATAKAIIQFRTKSGPFRRVEDLLAIRGISKHKLEMLRPYVIVNPPAKVAH